jgi:FkbM family methyltransferase
MGAIFHPRDEQALVQKYFEGVTGIFVDVGANDPVLNSQTYHLERLGWSGILIEPIPACAARLRAERKAEVFEGACGAREEVMNLHMDGVYSSLVGAMAAPPDRTAQVRVRRLDDILHDAGFGHVDFVSIDVEGFELDVLRGFALEEWHPRLVLVEDHVASLSLHRHLAARGYRLVRRTGVNAWYVPNELSFPLDLYGRWQLFRKYILGLPIRKLRNALRARRKRQLPS